MLPNGKALDDLFSKLSKAMKVIKFRCLSVQSLDIKGMTLGQMINVTDNVLCLRQYGLFPLYFHFVMGTYISLAVAS